MDKELEVDIILMIWCQYNPLVTIKLILEEQKKKTSRIGFELATSLYQYYDA